VLDARDAELWLDPALPPEQALQLARASALPSEAFEWHKVSPEMNRAGTDGPQITLPIEDTSEQP
jgi:putative SOS response-associated peptidase YedK